MARIRIRFHLSKKQRLFLEIGVAILCIILFLGALNTITYSQKVPILTTEDLWKNADVINVIVGYSNGTVGKAITYSLSELATFSNGKLYIALPSPPADIRNAKIKAITINLYSLNITWNDLVEKGVNRVELFLYIHNTTAFGTTDRTVIGLGRVDSVSKGIVYTGGGRAFVEGFHVYVVLFHDVWTKFYAKYMGSGVLENATTISVDVDPALLALTTARDGAGNARIGLLIGGHEGQKFLADYIVLSLNIYVVSEKPVLKALTEPVYSVVSGLWAALLAFWKRAKSYVASAFGGFSLSTLFTGLIGDPVTAMILSIMIITVLFLVMKKGRR